MSIRTKPNLRTEHVLTGLSDCCAAIPEGRVYEVAGLTVKSIGPLVSIGDLVWIEPDPSVPRRVACEVVGFRDRFVLLMPFERLGGVRPGARVRSGGRIAVPAGYALLGRVVDGLGSPLDEQGPLSSMAKVHLEQPTSSPLRRERLNEAFCTGIRVVDGLLTCAKGQRMGIFAGSGVGKSMLLTSLARNASSTVNVIALVGERGREVRGFVEDTLGKDGLAKSVVVAVTSDESPLMRITGAFTAMAIAEYFRDQGEDVLLLMDSVTRCAMAQREIGLAIGEPPTTKGYPPSVFGLLSRLLERSGTKGRGSITAFYTVLVEADDMNDPIADAVRAILDGHMILSRELASANHYPAVDVLRSVSRVMNDVAGDEHLGAASKVRSMLAAYRKAEDLIDVGAYVRGSNARIDEAVDKIEAIQAFLQQPSGCAADWEQMLETLIEVAR